jgi:uncharacterized protein YegP (UPF0339 family)
MGVDFDIRKSVNNQYYWRFNAANGEEIARSSETYTTKRGCMHSIKIVRQYAAIVTVYDLTGTGAKNVTAEVDNE